MIPWWGWLLIITVSIGLGVATIPFWFQFLLRIARWGQHLGYAREARRHNAKALALRLQRTEYFGYPLPTGQEGTLRITSGMMIHNPHRVTSAQLDRAFTDRALDLKVDIMIEHDVITRDIIVTWRPHKGKWPKEKY